MDVLPLAVAAVPDAGLLRLHGARHAIAVDVLGEADIGNAGSLLSNQVDMWVEQDGVDGLLPLRQSCRGQTWRKQSAKLENSSYTVKEFPTEIKLM